MIITSGYDITSWLKTLLLVDPSTSAFLKSVCWSKKFENHSHSIGFGVGLVTVRIDRARGTINRDLGGKIDRGKLNTWGCSFYGIVLPPRRPHSHHFCS